MREDKRPSPLTSPTLTLSVDPEQSHAPSNPELSLERTTVKPCRVWTVARVSSLRCQRHRGGSFSCGTLSAGVFAS